MAIVYLLRKRLRWVAIDALVVLVSVSKSRLYFVYRRLFDRELAVAYDALSY